MTGYLDRFDALGNRWIDDAINVRKSDARGLVYHYTDAAGLAGMLGSHELWLTHSRFLNDKTEGSHLMEMAKKLLAPRMDGPKTNVLKQFYISALTYANNLMSVSNQYGSAAFIFSLSRREDDLSQWRGYAKDGMGFTVGLDAKSLFEAASEPYPPFSFSKVEYNHTNQSQILETVLQEFEEQVAREIADDPNVDIDDVADEAARHFVWTVDNRSVFSKHRSFAGEDEWRLVTHERKTSDRIKVRVSGLSLVPYINLRPCGEDEQLPIRSIGIGPGFSDPAIENAVKSLCRQNGYTTDTVFADTPYRRP